MTLRLLSYTAPHWSTLTEVSPEGDSGEAPWVQDFPALLERQNSMALPGAETSIVWSGAMATEGSPPPFCGPIWLRVNRIFPLAAAPAWAVVAGIAIPRAVIAATAKAAAVFTRTSRLLDWVPD